MTGDEEETSVGHVSLFDGDAGSLPEGARRALVRLVQDPYISAERHGEAWAEMIKHREQIKGSLNDLLLDLVVDPDRELAYAVPAGDETCDFPKLKKERRLTELQSLLVVFLRARYSSQVAAGSERAWIDREDFHMYLRGLNAARTNQARAAQAVDSAVDFLCKRRYLEPVTGEGGRFRIMPIVESAFSLEQAVSLLYEYERAAKDLAGGLAVSEEGAGRGAE